MMKVLVHTGEERKNALETCYTDREIKFVSNRKELCENIVEEENLGGIVLELETIDRDNKAFLVSLHSNFPLLKIGLISPVAIEGDNMLWIDNDTEGELCNFVKGEFTRNKRNAHRFDWILHGYLGGELKEENKYKVRSLSSGGAFLESSDNSLLPGTVTTIRITFQNFQLFAECEVIERRNETSSLPDGYAVRFINIQQKTKELINRMVNDAVFQILIEPDITPDIPSLTEEELTADLMAL